MEFMTQRLYYTDAYLHVFDAQIVDISDGGLRVYLDRTAFYPTSGGQQFDLGTLNGVAIQDVADEGERIAHVLCAPLSLGPVQGVIDWTRRYDLMQQHTGQHLLSAICEELFGYATVSVHMGADHCTVDFDTPTINSAQRAAIERRCADVVALAQPTSVTFEDKAVASGLRKESTRDGTLRIVEIPGIDRSACGGTHVRNTAEIGPILLGRQEKVRSITRIEFACGHRAIAFARNNYELLSGISRALQVPPEHTLERIATLLDQNKGNEKERSRLSLEVARREGIDLFHATIPSTEGLRRVHVTEPLESARAKAQGYLQGGLATFLATYETSFLFATSPDSGIDAGQRAKAALSQVGGRGGGTATLAQGSVPDVSALDALVRLLQ
jgi:alanyl-tRNA synthetase